MREKRTFLGDFRKFFLRGLAILLPSLVTLALLVWAYSFLEHNIASPINWTVRRGVLAVAPRVTAGVPREDLPDWLVVTDDELVAAWANEARPRSQLDDVEREILDARVKRRVRARDLEAVWRDHWYLQGIGFVIAVVAVYLAGVLVGNYIGRRAYMRLESWMIRVPVIKQVYPNVKQIVDFLLGDENSRLPAAGKVVLVEYPRRGIWTVGLLTGGSMRSVEAVSGCDIVTIFIPSSPTPFTGYTINVPADEVHELGITFDEAIRFVVSGGVLVPPTEAIHEGRPVQPVRRVIDEGPSPETPGEDDPMR